MSDDAATAADEICDLIVSFFADRIHVEPDVNRAHHAADLLQRQIGAGHAEEFLVLSNDGNSQADHAGISCAFVEVGFSKKQSPCVFWALIPFLPRRAVVVFERGEVRPESAVEG